MKAMKAAKAKKSIQDRSRGSYEGYEGHESDEGVVSFLYVPADGFLQAAIVTWALYIFA